MAGSVHSTKSRQQGPQAASTVPPPPTAPSTYLSSSPSSAAPIWPASADSGFFQEQPWLSNQFNEDIALQRVLSLYLPNHLIKPLFHTLEKLADTAVQPALLRLLEDAERHPPALEAYNAFGRRRDSLHTAEGWRRLADFGARQGIVAEGYDGECGRIGQFARYYIYAPSAALTTCPAAMTDGAARLLLRHMSSASNKSLTLNDNPTPELEHAAREVEMQRRVFKAAYSRLTSRDPKTRWTSGQWMTERPGGSDISRTETIAIYSPLSPGQNYTGEIGPWVIKGYKFFSSATDSNMAVLLARTEGHKRLSAFFAPMRLPNGDTNNVRIVRLKQKMGTRALPTAELELGGMRAWMIGKEGEGVQQMAVVLNVTRVHNAVTAAGFMRRALAVAKAYSRVRVIAGGRTLSSIPLHVRTLSHLELMTRACTHIAFLTAHLLELTESASPDPYPEEITHIRTSPAIASKLLRLVTPLAKALTAKTALTVISECVEAMGGIGYLENEEPLNVARLLRDAQVLTIWEGTTNVLATDFVALLKKRREATEVLGTWIEENLANGKGNNSDRGELLEHCKVAVWEEWQELEKTLETKSVEELTASGRRILGWVGWVIVGTLFLIEARVDGHADSIETARRWIIEGEGWRRGILKGDEEKRIRADRGVVFTEGSVRPKL